MSDQSASPTFAGSPRPDTAWTVTERPAALDVDTVTRLGNKFLVANGYVGYRGTLEEYGRDEKVAAIVAGLYDQVGDLWREPVNLPNGGIVELEYGGELLHPLSSRVRAHSQSLDLRRAVHARETAFVAPDGTTLVVRARRFASLASLHLLVTEYSVEADRTCAVTIRTGVDADVWDLNGPHLEAIETFRAGGIVGVTACTHEAGVPVAVAESVFDGPDGLTFRRERTRIVRKLEVHLEAGRPATIRKVAAYHTGLDGADPRAAAIASCEGALRLGFDALLAAHVAGWEDRWRRCDVVIQGDEEAQLALRFSLYQLLAVAPTHTDGVSIPARGLSGQVYKGAIFWDTEIFMLPFFVQTMPDVARNLLMYRYRTLDGARRKAREYGFKGAYFAWESQDTGDDACTLFAVTDVLTNRPMRTYFRDKQFHISADVAYAIWNYVLSTGDESLLLDGGAEVIYECARFLASCTHYNPRLARYEILDVTGPDEYHERVNNNAYTNWMAARTYEICLELDEVLARRHPEFGRALDDRLGIAADLDAIREISARLYQPQPDPATLRIPQFDGYFALDDVPLAEILERKLHPNEYLGGGNGLATTSQIIKQADVVLGLYLFEERHSAAVKAANWEYYEPRTEHGSTLSACSYSLIAAQIGRIDWAYDYFMRTASIDLCGEPKQYVGTLYIGGTHPAANGGAWMAAVLGLCGVRSHGNEISIEPRLPDRWRNVVVPLVCRGQEVVLTIGRDEVSARRAGRARGDVFVRAFGVSRPVPPEGEVTILFRSEAVAP